MRTDAVGDLHGCVGPFDALLEGIGFNPDRDRLLLAGDLVNRGPDSLGALRRVYQLRDNVRVVLGNHDLHLLAASHGHTGLKSKDARQPILDARDRDELLGWLQSRPVRVEVPEFQAVMTHAGLPPLWRLDEARARALEVETVLASPDKAEAFFANMYGNTPAGRPARLGGTDRSPVITHHLPRLLLPIASRQLGPDEMRAYDAPFPDKKYKAGARAFPRLVPMHPNDPASEANRNAWKVLERWEKPFLTTFSNGDPISRGGDAYMQKRIPGAKDQPHVTLKGGHFLQEDSPVAFARAINGLLATLS